MIRRPAQRCDVDRVEAGLQLDLADVVGQPVTCRAAEISRPGDITRWCSGRGLDDPRTSFAGRRIQFDGQLNMDATDQSEDRPGVDSGSDADL